MFTTLFVQPIYNLFVALVAFMPQGDTGLAIIVLTIIMRVVLYPVFASSIRTQMGLQAMQGDLDEAKERHKNDREAMAKAQLELFKKHKVNPLATIGALVVQLVVVIALYLAMFREGFPAINEALLYPFIPVPAAVSTGFFGLFDLLGKNLIPLAILVALSQGWAIWLTLARTPKNAKLTGDQAATQQMQQRMMLYMMPVLMGVTSYFFANAVGLYFLISNLFSVGQEWYIRRQFETRT
jgi:YidC/Oxa1 family membrane protein insertase